jgi:hypothetical protein
MGQQDPPVGIHGHLRARNTSAMAPSGPGNGSFIFLGESANRYIVFVVGFPSLCYWMCDWLAGDSPDKQRMH